MGLAQWGGATEGHGRAGTLAETASTRFDCTAGEAPDADQPHAHACADPALVGPDTVPRPSRRTGSAGGTGSQWGSVRAEGVGLRVGRVPLSWFRRHGGRKRSVYGSRSAGAAAGGIVVWLGGLDVPGSRSVYRMGPSRAASQPVMHHQQPPVFTPALGPRRAIGKLDLGESAAAAFEGLAEQVRACGGDGGDVCGARSFSWHGVSGGQLAEDRGDARPDAAGSLYLAAGSPQRHLRVSTREELPRGVGSWTGVKSYRNDLPGNRWT